VEALGAAYQPVLDGVAGFGIVGSLPTVPSTFTAERLTGVAMVMLQRRASSRQVRRHYPEIRTDKARAVGSYRSLEPIKRKGVRRDVTIDVAAGRPFCKALFPAQWAWLGGMPVHVVQGDLAAGRLVELRIEDMPAAEMILPMSAVYPTSTPPGPAGRWLIERMKLCAGKST